MKISDEIINVLEYLGKKFGIAIDWTSSNVLPYIEQLCKKFIEWEISTSFAWIVIAIIVIIIGFVIALIVYKCIDLEGAEWLMWCILSFVMCIVIVAQTFDIIECKTFPEKAIYDYIELYTDIGD